MYSRDRIVVSTSRCGRDNPGSNPGHGSVRCGVAIMAKPGKSFLFDRVLLQTVLLQMHSLILFVDVIKLYKFTFNITRQF